MIVLIVIVVVFVNKASELGLNKFLWGFVGLAAYLGSQFLLGIIAALFMDVESITIDKTNELALNFVGIIFGGILAYIAYKQMPAYAEKDTASTENLLDEDMFR